MHTEEFVLIPKQMYTREQPHVSQLLSNKNIHNPAKQISLLQRNKSPSAPSASQQDTEQQTDASVDDKKYNKRVYDEIIYDRQHIDYQKRSAE